MSHPKEIATAWLGGYFDRAACITVTENYFPALIISSTNRSILERVQAQLDTAKLPRGYIKTFAENRKNARRFQLVIDSNDNVECALRALCPYLVVRKEEARLALQIISITRIGTDRTHVLRSPLFAALREQKRARGTLRQKGRKHEQFEHAR